MVNDFIEIKGLTKNFGERKLFGKSENFLKAVDDVSINIEKGKTLGLVGESGCGKSTLGRCLLRLVDADEGKIFYEGNDILAISEKEFVSYRKKMQIVFQDPYSTLNPRMTVGSILKEIVKFHKIRKGKEVEEYIGKLLDKVGLNKNAVNKYPHEFSGGQRQRIAIARALAVEPEFIVCDEPVSALDVSIQSQILNLLIDLQKDLGLTYLFISHDLSVVKHISDKIAVMYLGKIVEYGDTNQLFNETFHPYTITLLDSVPEPVIGIKKEKSISAGDTVKLPGITDGCAFAPRCPDAMEVCRKEFPKEFKDAEHSVYCHLKLK
ncbi:MAG: oligopeptide/dipeptide ABC transporter ATP-binding protein [Ignavibacteriota bacterium]|nr:ATP-binding cassette domain-containing protein [Ignavibacteriota bacterium]